MYARSCALEENNDQCLLQKYISETHEALAGWLTVYLFPLYPVDRHVFMSSSPRAGQTPDNLSQETTAVCASPWFIFAILTFPWCGELL